MINMENYLGVGGIETDLIGNYNRAAGVEYMSNYAQGQDIVLTRNSTTLDAQRVIVAPITGTTVEERFGPPGQQRTSTIDIMLIGPRNHPSLPDFDVARGDRFAIGTARYEVIYVDVSLNGKTEARCASFQ